MSRVAIRPATVADAEAIGGPVAATSRVGNATDDPPEVIARVAAGFDPDAVRGMVGRRRP